MNKNKKPYSIPTYRLQLVQTGRIEAHTITKPQDILKSINSFIRSDREICVGLYLNSRKQVIAYQVISIGTTNANLVHPREVFKSAIMKNACGVILAHNHPSGIVDPSEADLDVTKRIMDAGKLIGIELLDHIIITPDGKVTSIIKGHLNN